MDIRGIEVTNQLRSAIRAKLLELGVRYDEELPDYILVMVVNKKSRQQMHEDLYLFLEDSTTPFVDWLHDQVLKKLQRVTVAKKKSSREFVPTVVVKQEEERKKKKSGASSFLEDQGAEQSIERSVNKTAKEDKPLHKHTGKSVTNQTPNTFHSKTSDKSAKHGNTESKSDNVLIHNNSQEDVSKKAQPGNVQTSTLQDSSSSVGKSVDSCRVTKVSDALTKCLKRTVDAAGHDTSDKKDSNVKRSKILEGKDDTNEDNAKRLKSCVNKPKITSVVSVKNRLGIVSPRKKFETYREKTENENRHRQSEKRFEKYRFETNRNSNFSRNRNLEVEDRLKKNRDTELWHCEADKVNDIKNRLGNIKGDKCNKTAELREKVNSDTKMRISEKPAVTVKDRLGISSKTKTAKQPLKKAQEVPEVKNTKYLEQDREVLSNNKNIKKRLGPFKNNFKPVCEKDDFVGSGMHSESSEDDDCLNLSTEDGLDEEVRTATSTVGSLKSHIIAVKSSVSPKIERKKLKPLEKINKRVPSDIEEDNIEETKLPSKVIVTPRPLKPLQPAQKRATQSLLLRAVAEANQSVVTQKNPEPSLVDKKPALKRPKIPSSREVGQNLSVHLNASKRLVMEKIQVELSTGDSVHKEVKPYVPQGVTEEHMGVVMSLFQRGDDNQKFLVTLNGYNNNLAKDKTISDDDERLEMEVNEDDELALLTNQNEIYVPKEPESNVFRITNVEDDVDLSEKEGNTENNENCNTENVDIAEDQVPRKKRKLSPIIYNRSDSPSTTELKSTTLSNAPFTSKSIEKKTSAESAVPVIDKTREKCRYWPNCTLGNKCAYSHPAVICSAFPACKFGDKCAYKHPKCKFGLSCTKLGCVFSHPAQQCKYHPFCSKPGCPYSHPVSHTALSVEATSQRAKFTWRRRD